MRLSGCRLILKRNETVGPDGFAFAPSCDRVLHEIQLDGPVVTYATFISGMATEGANTLRRAVHVHYCNVEIDTLKTYYFYVF